MRRISYIPLLFFPIILSIECNSQNLTLPVWPDGIPGSIRSETYFEESEVKGDIVSIYEKVTNPSLTVFLPPADKATGIAVLICPGGGYRALAFDYEGTDIARWLNANGIAGIVLKYRLPSDMIMKDKSVGPLQDAQESMRIIRRNSSLWNINKNKIGVMGFSAGGHLASTLSTHYEDRVYDPKDSTSARPDFTLLIYPVITLDATFTHMGSRINLIGESPSDERIRYFSNEQMITRSSPPAFLVHSSDDKVVPVKNSIVYYEALVNNNIPAEIHNFQKGGHGFGLAANRGTESAWPDLCLRWLKEILQ